MKAIDVFRQHKDAVTALWTETVFNTYPFETTGFLRTKHDPFGNPVAHMTKEAAAALYDAVTSEHVAVEQVRKALDTSSSCGLCKNSRQARVWGSSAR